MDASNPQSEALSHLAFNDLAAQQDRVKDRIDAAMTDVLARGQCNLGPQVAELEGALAYLAPTIQARVAETLAAALEEPA